MIHKNTCDNFTATCGGAIFKDEGFLTSPNYPNNYTSQTVCKWRITVESNFYVAFQFREIQVIF